jgi:hypothetical protein
LTQFFVFQFKNLFSAFSVSLRLCSFTDYWSKDLLPFDADAAFTILPFFTIFASLFERPKLCLYITIADHLANKVVAQAGKRIFDGL